MAAYYTVVLHKGMGLVGGLFTNAADAIAYVGTKPAYGFEIVSVTVDASVGVVIPQGGVLVGSQSQGLTP
jgi:hypothetical protein